MKGIRDFCDFVGLSPSEVVERFRSADRMEILGFFNEWFVARRDVLATKTIWDYLVGVKALLIENDVYVIDLISREIAREFRRSVGKVRSILKRDIVTKEEIIRLLKIAPMREKALICLLATSGLRVRAAVNLRLKHFKDDLWDRSLSCYAIEVPEELSKERTPYITFCTWEAAEYIRSYLEVRKNQGETITRETPIFISKTGKPLSVKRFENTWPKLCMEAGIDLRPVRIVGRSTQYHRFNTRIHALRKFFKTTLRISGVDRLVTEALMGHSLTAFGVESIYDYSVTHMEFLKSEYLKALNALLFLKKPRGLEVINGEARKKLQKLEERLSKLEEKIEQFSSKGREFLALAAQIEELYKRYSRGNMKRVQGKRSSSRRRSSAGGVSS